MMDGRGRGQEHGVVWRLAYGWLVALIVFGGPSSALAASAGAATITAPAHSVSPDARSATTTAAAAGGSGAVRADPDVSPDAPHFTPITPHKGPQFQLLRSLLATPRGRALLRHTYGAATLAAMERTYGTTAPSFVPPLTVARRPLAGPALHPRANAPAHLGADAPVSPTIGLVPSSGAIGNSIVVTGTGFAAYESLDMVLDTGAELGTSYTDGAGNLSIPDINNGRFSFVVPAGTPPGSHTLTAVDRRTNARVTTALRVYALSANGQQASPGGTVTVSGVDFAPGQVVTFTLGQNSGNPITLTTTSGTDSAGALAPISLTVPTTAPFELSGLSAFDGAGEGVTIPFEVVQSSLILTPTAGQSGDTIAPRADGFRPYEGVSVYVDNVRVRDTNAGGDGVIAPRASYEGGFTIPIGLTPGPHTVEALGVSSGHAITGTLRVFALTTAPGRAPDGAPVAIGGAGFTPGETVAITLGTAGAGTGSTTVDTSGSIIPMTLTVPAGAPSGALPVTATGSAGKAASTSIQVIAAGLAVSPTTGQPGTTVTLSGDGYGPSDNVYFYQDGVFLGNVNADQNGRFSASVSIPSTYNPGAHSIMAFGLNSGHTLSTPFREYAIAASPYSGPAGSTLNVSGAGFSAGTPISLSFLGQTATTTSGADGSITPTAFTVPAGRPAGAYPITASDALSETANTVFHVAPTQALTLTPDSGVSGQSIGVSFSGFFGDDVVDIYVGGDSANGTRVASIGANGGATGANSSYFTLPEFGQAGPITATAYGHGNNGPGAGGVATTVFTVTTALRPAQLAAPPGATVGVTGTGFLPNETVDLLLDGAPAGMAPNGGPSTAYPAGHAVADASGTVVAARASPSRRARTTSTPTGIRAMTWCLPPSTCCRRR